MEYLAQRGHTPVNHIGGGKYRYLCPFSDHKETVPSFVVFTNSEYENFWCFGCCSGHSIINLVARLDNISYKEALDKLSDGVVVSTEDDIKYTLDRIKKEIITTDPVSELSRVLLEISWQCFLYTQGVQFDPYELKIIDNYYSFVDDCILNTEFDKIEKSLSYLSLHLARRKKKFWEVNRRRFLIENAKENN